MLADRTWLRVAWAGVLVSISVPKSTQNDTTVVRAGLGYAHNQCLPPVVGLSLLSLHTLPPVVLHEPLTTPHRLPRRLLHFGFVTGAGGGMMSPGPVNVALAGAP